MKPLPPETAADKSDGIKTLANQINKALKDAETAEDVAAIWKERAADLETVKAASAKAYQALEKVFHDRGPKEIAPSTAIPETSAEVETGLAV